jgi:hypothetical protein
VRAKPKRRSSGAGAQRKPRQKHTIFSPANSRVSARVTARLECLDDDPLEFFDFGMRCAYDLAEAQLLGRLRRGEVLKAEAVREVFAKEREAVDSADLHSFYLMADTETPSTDGEPPS